MVEHQRSKDMPSLENSPFSIGENKSNGKYPQQIVEIRDFNEDDSQDNIRQLLDQEWKGISDKKPRLSKN